MGASAKSGNNGLISKIVGGILMVSGAIVLLICVPGWFWTMLLGVILIASGFLIWRFNC